MKPHIVFIGVAIAIILNIAFSQVDLLVYGKLLSDVMLSDDHAISDRNSEILWSPTFVGYSLVRLFLIYGFVGFFVSSCASYYRYSHISTTLLIILVVDYMSSVNSSISLQLYVFTTALIVASIFLGAKIGALLARPYDN